MKTHKKYDPEDIESLLQHKSFDELYPEERAFVLNHMESPEEYASMRQTLLELQSIDWDKDGIEPRKEIKERLMEEFVVERKGGFIVWLNTLFAQGKSVSWYRSGGFQVAMGVVIIALVGTWFFTSQNAGQDMIAEVKQSSQASPMGSSDSLENNARSNAPIPAPVEDEETAEEAEFRSLDQQDEIRESAPESYRAEERIEGDNLEEYANQTFALAAENESIAQQEVEFKDIALADAVEDDQKVSKRIQPKEIATGEVLDTIEFKEDLAFEIAVPEEAYADEIQIDNNMGNSVSQPIALESRRVQSSSDFNVSEISVNDAPKAYVAEGQSIRRYKGLLDELYTSY